MTVYKKSTQWIILSDFLIFDYFCVGYEILILTCNMDDLEANFVCCGYYKVLRKSCGVSNIISYGFNYGVYQN